MKKRKTSLHPPFYNSESTGFQPVIDQSTQMNSNENIKTHWPRKLASVMEIHRQRFSELNKKFKQKSVVNHSHPPPVQPLILSQSTRPQPRQQTRSKEQLQAQFSAPRRSNTAYIQKQPPSILSHNQEYITLANLSNILHVLQTEEKTHDNSDTGTDASASTSTSVKQRVQQHLQATATRWWRPIKSSDSHPTSSIIHASETSSVLQQYTDDSMHSQRNLPLLTIVSNSTRQINLLSTNRTGKTKYEESETSIEHPTTKVFSSFAAPAKIRNIQRTRQEPLIMQARGMHRHSYAHQYNNNYNTMNFFQQQRLIRQT